MELTFNSPEEFARFYFDWTPFSYQKDFLNDTTTKKQAVGAGRQTGKSDNAAIKALYHAFTFPFVNIFILAPSKEQSQIIFDKIRNFIHVSELKHPELKLNSQIRREIATRIEFNNGSIIRNFTIGPENQEAKNLRGFTIHMVVLDEAAQIPDKAFSTIMPALSATALFEYGGFVILTSTPKGVNNKFYDYMTKPELGFKTHHWTSDMNPLISKSFLEEERLAKNWLEYAEEYEGKFVDVSDAAFPESMVSPCVNYELPERAGPIPDPTFSYYASIDPSEGIDDCVVNILEIGPTYKFICKTYEISIPRGELAAPKIIDEIYHIFNAWHPKRLYIDATGFGQSIAQMIMSNPKYEQLIEPIRFNGPLKMDVFMNLKTQLSNKTFLIPPNKKMIGQLLEIRQVRKPDGKYEFVTRANKHDDYVTALALVALTFNSLAPPIAFARSRGVW